ncbi:hypothetical protein C8D88_10474 [Lentzea atacamensis]|uniref:Uncharacterized protein n=1 Tax=Lentzea atacamensis TaxID=531938 RepID=A0A316I1N6_9PSEU|nr:hypothetical protein C8D88_10474 [Lentzea atacamensis]
MRGLRGRLQVVRVVVRTRDDDHLLGPPGDEELSVPPESGVAGAQERAAPAGQLGVEHLVRSVPVAGADARALHEDLPGLAVRAFLQRAGIGHHQRDRRRHRSAAHQPPATGRLHRPDPLLRERVGVAAQHDRALTDHRAGDHHRGLREAVARHERAPAQTRGREHLAEPVERLGTDRFAADERHLPPAQVEAGQLHLGDAPHTQVEREVRRAAVGPADLGDEPQPADRAADEHPGGEQQCGPAGVDRVEHTAHQSHVVVRRQPGHAGRPGQSVLVGRAVQVGVDQREVVQDVAVGQRHALGLTGGSRGVLQIRRRVDADGGRLPPVGRRRHDLVGREPHQAGEHR